jgi:hypothetical protein
MPVLTIIAIGFLTLSLTAALTIAWLPLGMLPHQGWFSAPSEISLWLLLLLCGFLALVLLAVRSETRFRERQWTLAGSALLAAGVLLGVEIFLIQARPPFSAVTTITLVTPAIPATLVALVRPSTISLWGLFIGCTGLGVIAVYSVEKTRRMERQAEEERAQAMERQAQAACADARMRERLRLGRRHVAARPLRGTRPLARTRASRMKRVFSPGLARCRWPVDQGQRNWSRRNAETRQRMFLTVGGEVSRRPGRVDRRMDAADPASPGRIRSV